MISDHLLLFDLSNVTYFAAYQCGRGIENHPEAPQRIKESALQLMRSIYLQVKPDHAIFACDHATYWRRELYPKYKGQRKLTLLKQQVRLAIELIKKEKPDVCLEIPKCEADDIIYALTKHAQGPVTIVSSDSDFEQLHGERVARFHPKSRTYLPKPKNAAFALFEKCIRGDVSDNIPSAYPFVSKKRLQTAFKDELFMRQLLQSINREGKRVADCYHFNRQLIDLSLAPIEIQVRCQAVLEKRFAACKEKVAS